MPVTTHWIHNNIGDAIELAEARGNQRGFVSPGAATRVPAGTRVLLPREIEWPEGPFTITIEAGEV